MSSVLPEFVNKIVNKVTNNGTQQVQKSNTPPKTNVPQPKNTSSNNKSIDSELSNELSNNIDISSSNSMNNTSNINSMSKNNSKNSTLTTNNTFSRNNISNLNSSIVNNVLKNTGKNNSVSLKKQNTSSGKSIKNEKNEKFDNLTNAEKMRELIDSIIGSDLSIDKRNRVLNVIKSALTPTQTQENMDFDKFNQRYDMMHQGMYMPPQYPFPAVPGNMYMPTMQYAYPGMGGNVFMPPQYPYTGMGSNMYMQPYQQGMQGGPMQYDMLFNKMNMIQMEMADLTRHLRDYTRRYMDNMRESDMDQIKNYIEELMNVQESVNQVAESLPSVESEDEDKSSLMDKATTSLKSGLSTVTNTVNSIGSKLGLTDDESPTTTQPTEPVSDSTSNTDIKPEELDNEELNDLPVEEGEEKPADNMVSVEDYAKQNQPPQPTVPAKVNNKKNATKPAELSDAIKELNKQNKVQQQGGRLKRKTKKETSILEQFEKMLNMKRKTKKNTSSKNNI